jgi:hypothetical protein
MYFMFASHVSQGNFGEFFVARLLSLLNSIVNSPAQNEHLNPCTYWYIISDDDDLESTRPIQNLKMSLPLHVDLS